MLNDCTDFPGDITIIGISWAKRLLDEKAKIINNLEDRLGDESSPASDKYRDFYNIKFRWVNSER